MRTYYCQRINGDAYCNVHDEAHGTICIHPLRNRLDLANHSPDGFEWGYGGSGPAQLALSLLADALQDDQRALSLYQRFKWKWIVNRPRSDWTITQDELIKAAEEIEVEH